MNILNGLSRAGASSRSAAAACRCGHARRLKADTPSSRIRPRTCAFSREATAFLYRDRFVEELGATQLFTQGRRRRVRDPVPPGGIPVRQPLALAWTPATAAVRPAHASVWSAPESTNERARHRARLLTMRDRVRIGLIIRSGRTSVDPRPSGAPRARAPCGIDLASPMGCSGAGL